MLIIMMIVMVIIWLDQCLWSPLDNANISASWYQQQSMTKNTVKLTKELKYLFSQPFSVVVIAQWKPAWSSPVIVSPAKHCDLKHFNWSALLFKTTLFSHGLECVHWLLCDSQSSVFMGFFYGIVLCLLCTVFASLPQIFVLPRLLLSPVLGWFKLMCVPNLSPLQWVGKYRCP